MLHIIKYHKAQSIPLYNLWCGTCLIDLDYIHSRLYKCNKILNGKLLRRMASSSDWDKISSYFFCQKLAMFNDTSSKQLSKAGHAQ